MSAGVPDRAAPACRFYARHGFTLAAVDANGYPGLPDEIQLIWTKPLGAVVASG